MRSIYPALASRWDQSQFHILRSEDRRIPVWYGSIGLTRLAPAAKTACHPRQNWDMRRSRV